MKNNKFMSKLKTKTVEDILSLVSKEDIITGEVETVERVTPKFRTFIKATFKGHDGEWVQCINKPIERFIGYKYLSQKIKEKTANEAFNYKWSAAKTVLVVINNNLFAFSQYVGENKPEFNKMPGNIGYYNNKAASDLTILSNEIGFTDYCYKPAVNMRIQDGTIIVIDTEKGSFDKSVHDKVFGGISKLNIKRFTKTLMQIATLSLKEVEIEEKESDTSKPDSIKKHSTKHLNSSSILDLVTSETNTSSIEESSSTVLSGELEPTNSVEDLE